MAQTTTAIYENGVLRPLVSLDLPEHSEVEITIEDSDSIRDRIDKALGSLIMKFDSDVEPISDERRAELAELFSGDPPVSSYIREDRDSRDDSI